MEEPQRFDPYDTLSQQSSPTLGRSESKQHIDKDEGKENIIEDAKDSREKTAKTGKETKEAKDGKDKKDLKEKKERKESIGSSKRRTSSAGTASKSGTPRGGARSQTLLINSKIRHIKKKDGEPLWRKDIQYDFLKAVFYDETKAFTNSYDGTPNHTYAEIYVDAMARSSKSSKVLREKLLGDRQAGLNIAMVCLLVNIGRMNTTLNFFPEMRAQLRTYHPIPSLQTYSDPTAYKQLQDAPRLKSILKGACEDRPEPSTLDQLLLQTQIPRTNPINLAFILATYARRVTDDYFVAPYEFYDLIMNVEISSQSRARAFLWLMWVYLESDMSPEQIRSNPFGIGQDNGQKIPSFVTLAPGDVESENVDTDAEKDFAVRMIEERKK
ncbi:hypothetical protein V1511DRAFT_459133, partial [Dipodascopsis uninucleata]